MKPILGLLFFVGIAVCGVTWMIMDTLADRRIKQQWFAECIADGRKAYECNGMVNTFLKPMR